MSKFASHKPTHKLRLSQGIYVERIKPDACGLKVWLVNGQKIRDMLFIDFTMGGHDLIYPTLVPKHEVWLDQNMNDQDRKATLLHELVERGLMAQGVKYDTSSRKKDKQGSMCAHDQASELELAVLRRKRR